MKMFDNDEFSKAAGDPVAKIKYLQTLTYKVCISLDDVTLTPRRVVYAMDSKTLDWTVSFGFIEDTGSDEEMIVALQAHFKEMLGE